MSPRARVIAAIALSVLAATPSSAGAQTLYEHTFTMKTDPREGVPEVVTTPPLRKGARYRFELSGTIRYPERPPIGASPSVPAYDCDVLFCVSSADRVPQPLPGGILAVARAGSTNFLELDVFMRARREVAFSPSRTYSETFRASADGPIRLSGPGTTIPSFPAEGQVRVVLREAGALELGLSHEMDARYEPGDGGKLPEFDTPGEIDPDRFTVRLKVKRRGGGRCDEGLSYRFKADGATLKAERGNRDECQYTVRLPEGRRKIEVRSRDRFGKVLDGEERIVVQDFLIFGIGDSAGAGEGTGRGWMDSRCHRSRHSQQVLAARRLEERDEQSSVTFVHLACSGARIDFGLYGGYPGIEEETPDLRPQLDELKTRARGREIDAVQMSVGVNDLSFGPLLGHCVAEEACQEKTFLEGLGAAAYLRRSMGELPEKYGFVAERLTALLPPESAERVLITEYPELFRDEKGALCDSVLSNPTGAIARDEIEFLESEGAAPLQDAVETAARTHGWTRAAGIRRAFRRHGYCSNRGNRWIVQLTESLANQRDSAGTMHPNHEGYRQMAGFVTKALGPVLFPGGEARAPYEPLRGLGLTDQGDG